MRRLSLAVALILLMLVSALPTISSHAQETSDVNVPVRMAGNVVLRSGPGWNTAWWEYLPRGYETVAIARSANGLWLQVLAEGYQGWVPTSALRRRRGGQL
ncbi:MAG: hypothetical protein HC915_19250 [Anaerolineae bacterium]|nr:hypothetical protein [Anaerolineae bacterium]